MSSNVSFGGCGSVCAHAQLSPFYLLSTPRRQSRDKLYQAFRSLNFLRVKGRQRERMAWERGYQVLSDWEGLKTYKVLMNRHMEDLPGGGLIYKYTIEYPQL